MLGLYKHTRCSGYDDEPGSEYDELLAIDDSAENLVNRWNAHQDAARQKLRDKGCHISYIRGVPPNFAEGLTILNYSGNTGGGWRHVDHTISIKLVKQFDKTTK